MNITFHGAAGTVTGSCFEVETLDLRFLVDCGMFQGDARNLNRRILPFNPADIDFILLTHAHIDHSGLLPLVAMYGFSGTILCTKATRDLCSILLPDSGHIQEVEAQWRSRKGQRRGLPAEAPLYTQTDAERTLKLIKGVNYDTPIELSDTTSVSFRDAGHILGSAFLELDVTEGTKATRVTFSGDLGNVGQPIIRDPQPLSSKSDFLVMESTYGGRSHGPLADRAGRLAEIIGDTIHRNGNLVIPSFAVERTQDLLYEISALQTSGAIPKLPIYVDSPLATSATQIYVDHPECFDRETASLLSKDSKLFDGHGVHFVRDSDASRALNDVTKSIIISSSGMCDAGRIQHHLKHNLWRPESTVLFVGYQANGTLGRRIVDGADEVSILGEAISVRCRIEVIEQFSAHADESGLLDWVSGASDIGSIFLVHGEESSLTALSQAIQQRFGIASIIPLIGCRASIKGTGAGDSASEGDGAGHSVAVEGPTLASPLPESTEHSEDRVSSSLERLSSEASRLAFSLKSGVASPDDARRALEILRAAGM